jgi:hypothetical protein
LAYGRLLGVIEVTDKPPPQPRGRPSPAERRRFGYRGWLVLAAIAGAIIVFANIDLGNRASDNTAATTTATTSPAFTLPTTAIAPPATSSAGPSTSATTDSQAPPAADAESSAALAKLATLPIEGRAPKTGYDRNLFGDAWTDDVSVAGGHNGCDTRNDILGRDLIAGETKLGWNGCTVLAGTLNDPYTGDTVAFSPQVQIDHVVALSDAWQKGAQQWHAPKLRNFANDPINLQATIGSINQQKGDGDAATWLPPDKSYRCTYVSRIVDVKATYELWVTQAEHDAIARILTNCDAPDAPTESAVSPSVDVQSATTEPPVAVPPQPEVTSEYVPPPLPVLDTGPSVYYPSCKAAKAAGAAPLYAGEPGYRSGLDGDGDGVACER